ncbi:MAG: class I SAM-dependent methyltransferase [Anaerolineae bacterium]|nr:class I SAM-dependent methyltransferase [Anaerolineae bacterium]
MSQNLYEDFAGRYDLFHSGFDDHDPLELAFFRRLFAENQVRSVLDCACGTGKHLHLFHLLGCEVVGSDTSAAMLAQAEKNLSACGLDLPLHQVDYRELPQYFDRQFDAVACLSSSIHHMPNETEAANAFKSMLGVLRPGKILVLTQGTTDKQWQEKPRFIPAINQKDFTRLFVIDYLGAGARYNILDIFHSDELCDFKVWSVEYPRMYLKNDQERLLKTAGFKVVDAYGSYDFEAYDSETSRRLILVARK